MTESDAKTLRSVLNLKELSDKQRKEYKSDVLKFSMHEKHYERISQELKTVDNAIRTSAKQYISLNELRSSARKIIQLLAIKYKLD
jgi:hypothetical protein